MEIEQKARDFYTQYAAATLGEVTSVEKQIVSGINFKITFAAPAGVISDSGVVIVVYAQPWTKTIQILSVNPSIDGVTDEFGKVLVEIVQN
jgi:hypothetical protein